MDPTERMRELRRQIEWDLAEREAYSAWITLVCGGAVSTALLVFLFTGHASSPLIVGWAASVSVANCVVACVRLRRAHRTMARTKE